MSQPKGYEHAYTFNTGDLQVSDIHRIHYSRYGKPDGKPVIFLHGGPGGSGCSPTNAAFFDPAIFHIVLLDQRGAGQSTPSAETRDNNTQALVSDIEKLREHLAIKKWHMVFGGSWGSTLALAYAQAHPNACGSLVIRGVFLGTMKELDLVMKGHLTANLYPKEYDRFIAYLPEEKRDDPLKAYHELIMSDDPEVARKAAREWNRWETSVSKLVTETEELEEKLEDYAWNKTHGCMEVHCFVNGCFLGKDQLLNGCEKIKHIPTRIVQGRYDLVCPPRAAYEIHKRLPKSELYFGATAGHSAFEPDNFKKLVEWCDELGKLDLHL
ncbi:proline iminopeptidase [Byssothecium circinans]|uniref:Proline iminopeptidase n=1 Tax=Byssothecium circinans TaxID=147558 RepID=A0A6A5UEK8_9PLEO|nr:proline iminopeptidase [Byssothecium circinans]